MFLRSGESQNGNVNDRASSHYEYAQEYVAKNSNVRSGIAIDYL